MEAGDSVGPFIARIEPHYANSSRHGNGLSKSLKTGNGLQRVVALVGVACGIGFVGRRWLDWLPVPNVVESVVT